VVDIQHGIRSTRRVGFWPAKDAY